jgi:hypothetical protein
MNKTIYIYGLSGNDGIIRYVGQSYRPNIRKNEHINDSKYNKGNTHKINWIKSIIKKGEDIQVTILEECNSNNWVEREKYWISHFDNLTNISMGGEGNSGTKYKLPFYEIKSWRKNNAYEINTEEKWRKHVKFNHIPEYIPKRPDNVYKNRGWISWNDFFNFSEKDKFINYDDLILLLNVHEIYSIPRYRNFRLTYTSTKKLPYDPVLFYNKKSWKDISPTKKKFKKDNKKQIVDFSTAKNTIKNHNFTKKCEYTLFVKSNHHLNLPSEPRLYYKNDWISWEDFFGNNLPKNILYKGSYKRKTFLSYEETKKWVNNNLFDICSESKWRKITKTLPKYIPKRPDNVYKTSGWISWGSFLKK